MSEPSSFDNGYQFAWDSSTLKAAEACPRLYYYTYVEGWRGRTKSVHLTFGGHYATALEHFHKYIAEGMEREEAIETIIYELLVATWIISGSKDGVPIGKPWESFDPNKNRETLIRSVIWYLDFFEDDPMSTVILPSGKPAVEQSFKLNIDNGLVYCGHIDRLVDYGGKLYITDNKTTASTITARFFEGFSPDTQMSGYAFAGAAVFELPVEGIVIDAAQIAVSFTRFERGFSPRSNEQLDEWYEGMLDTVDRMHRYTDNKFFPMNTTACGNYGGCAFRSVCSRSPAIRKSFLKADFTQEPLWNPLIPR